MRKAARDARRDPDGIELTVSPTGWRFGASADYGVCKAYAELGVKRLIIAAHEAPSTDLAEIERFVKTCRDNVMNRL